MRRGCAGTGHAMLHQSWFHCVKFHNRIMIPFDHENEKKNGSVSAKKGE